MSLTPIETINWLKATDLKQLQELWTAADKARHENVGDEVHLRGLIEISNICVRRCAYCGISAINQQIERYCMQPEEIIACAQQAVEFGYGTVVLQAGENLSLTKEWVETIVKRIKKETPLAVTLSLGERSHDELAAWKQAGADRYLLRFETSDPELFKLIHPSLPNTDSRRDRITILKELRALGYEIGSGVMIGIPGQSYASLASDIQLFSQLDLDMIGVGPYLPDPNTPLGAGKLSIADLGAEQVPNTELMTYKTIALTRLTCPQANIPSTTALATINKAQGRELGLMRGANIVMPNLTPPKYRINYTIYPNKACLTDTAEACNSCLHLRITSLGRKPGRGKGGRGGK